MPPRLTAQDLDQEPTPRYNAAAAKLAWERTVAFFKTHLR